MIDHENFGRTCLRFEAKAELVGQILLKCWFGGCSAGIRAVNALRRVLEGEIVGACEAGLIEDGTV